MTITFRARTKAGFTVDSPLKPFTFPDGQAFLKGTENFNFDLYEYHIADVRGFDPQDYWHLRTWVDFIHEASWMTDGSQSVPKTVLLLPYLPGARSDRDLPLGVRVYGSAYWELALDQIIALDPHSPAALDYFKGMDEKTTVFPFERIIRREIQDHTSDSKPAPYTGVIAPDHGAVDRATRAARVMGVPVYKAGKTRDPETGKLSGFHMEDELPKEGKLLIVDDICDGGGTFIGLAEATGLPKDRVDLWVSHGIFSKGLADLRKHFGSIHTTDSYYSETPGGFISGTTYPADPDLVTVHKIIPYLTEAINV